jgi:hypothetical protein
VAQNPSRAALHPGGPHRAAEPLATAQICRHQNAHGPPTAQVWVEDLHRFTKSAKRSHEFREWLSELHLHSELAHRAVGREIAVREAAVPVTFKLQYRCNFGQNMCITGVAKTLGSWNVEQAVPLEWGDGDVWSASVHLNSE